MTISSSTGRQRSINQVCTMALKRAGLLEMTQTPREEVLRHARDSLETIIDALAAEGIQARATTFENLTLESGTYKYTLPSDVLDVIGDGMYIGPNQDVDKADGELLVKWISADEWHTISPKGAEGSPLRMYVHRELDDVQVWFWPIPDEAGTVRLMVQRELADVDDGAATLDLQNYWINYLVFELAHHLAEDATLEPSKRSMLAQQAAAQLVKAKGKAYDLGVTQATLDHDVGWRF